MDILKIFKLDNNEFTINIQGDINFPLFQANQIAKILEIKNIHTSIENFDNNEKVIRQTETQGGVQKVIFITELGLYKLLFRSNKPIAKEFQSWVVSVIKEIRLNGIYDVSNKDNEIDKQLDKRNAEIKLHNSLIYSFDKKRVIYIVKLDTLENVDNTNKSVYKIGSTDRVKKRMLELQNEYGPCSLINIYQCNNFREFEKFILKNPELEKYKYEKQFSHKSRETFLLNDEEYNILLKIIERNHKNYTDYDTEQYIETQKLKLEEKNIKMEFLKLELQKKEIEYKLAKIQKDIPEEYKSDTEEDDNISIISSEKTEDIKAFTIKKRNNTRSPIIQKYDPNTFELLQSYNSLIDITRINPDYSKSALKNSVKNNTIYKEFRWHFINKTEPNIKYELEKTNELRKIQRPLEPVAMLDIKKEKIIEVYSSQKEASIERNFTNGASICRAINIGSICSGHYWIYYYDCSDELKNTYNKKIPEIGKKNGKKVEILNIKTKEVEKTIDCVEDVLKEYQLSRTKLFKIIGTDEIYKGVLFRYLIRP